MTYSHPLIDCLSGLWLQKETQLTILEYLHSEKRLMRGLAYAAINLDRMDVLDWIKENDIDTLDSKEERDGMCNLASSRVNIETLKWTVERGYHMNVERCIEDARDALRDVMTDGRLHHRREMEIMKNYVNMIEWMESHAEGELLAESSKSE